MINNELGVLSRYDIQSSCVAVPRCDMLKERGLEDGRAWVLELKRDVVGITPGRDGMEVPVAAVGSTGTGFCLLGAMVV